MYVRLLRLSNTLKLHSVLDLLMALVFHGNSLSHNENNAKKTALLVGWLQVLAVLRQEKAAYRALLTEILYYILHHL